MQGELFVLHLTVVVWKGSNVIGKVETVELRQECPLYTIVPGVVVLMIQSITKRKWIRDTKQICRTRYVSKRYESERRAFQVFIVPQYLSQCLSVHAVERFLGVNEVDIEEGLLFQWLFNDDTQTGYLICCV